MPCPAADQPQDHAESIATGLTRIALRRRITVLVLLLTIIVVGLVSSVGIPLELFPRGFTGHSLQVFVPWQDAPVQEVLNRITLPLEEELGTVRGIDQINAYSGRGQASAFLKFKRGTDMDVAYREVRDRIQRARLLFPPDADRVFIRKQDASGIPVVVIGMAIDPSLTDYHTLIRRQIVQRFERIDGVANVETDGLQEKEIIIEVDRQRAESTGLNLYQLSQDLAADNFSMASGTVRDHGRKLLLRSLARYPDIDAIENLPLSPAVRLRDIAAIRYEEPERDYSVRVNSRPAVALVIFKEGEANTVEVSRRVAEEFERLRKDPRLSAMYTEILFNQGEVVEESLAGLVEGGLLGGAMAAAVLFFFLRRLRLTGIITLSIPISLLMAMAALFFTGETLNMLTILGLVIAVGMLVDNSIVVAENIHRLHREGRPRVDACVHGAGEIALAITLATLTTIIVFVPAALIEGEAQFFLIRLALPISAALLASLGVALVFIPLSVYVTLPSSQPVGPASALRRAHDRLHAALRHAYDRTLGKLNRVYVRALGLCLRRPLELVVLLMAAFAITYGWAARRLDIVGQQEEDRSSFEINFEASNEYGFDDMAEYFTEVERVMESRKGDYGLKGYLVFFSSRHGRVEGWLDDSVDPPYSAKELEERVQKELPRRPGIRIFLGDENRVEEARGQSVFVIHLEGDDAGELEEIAERLEPVFLAVPGVLGMRRGEQASRHELALRIDRQRTSAAGVDPEVIAGLIGYALRGNPLPKFNRDGREIPVRIRFEEADRETLVELGGFQVPSEAGGRVALAALTDARIATAPRGIFRRNKRITRTITLELAREDAAATRERLAGLQRVIALPEGVTFGSTAVEDTGEEISAMMFAAGLSVAFIYLLMGFLFESFVLPLSIIMTIPLAGIGVVWMHLMAGMDLDMLGLVGIVLLIGVVVNNGIVLIDCINRLRQEGHSRIEALLLSAERRFRPILMTALTTIIGMVPLTASAPTEIGLSYRSFGLTLIGGLTSATFLTLLVVPVFYVFFDDLRSWFMRILGAAFATPPGTTASHRASP